MRLGLRIALVLGLAALLAGPAFAQGQRRQGQRGGGFGQGGVGQLLQNESVQKELKMDPDQVTKTKEAVTKVTEAHRDDTTKLREITDMAERREKSQALNATITKETLAAVGDILKPDQLKRLHQIQLQTAGLRAFSQADVQTALKLNDDQKAKIKTITDDANKELAEFRPMRGAGGGGGGARPNPENQAKIQAIQKAATEKVQGVLTDDQKKSWKDMTGEPFQLQAGGRRRTDTN
jgi:hypothetical protein